MKLYNSQGVVSLSWLRPIQGSGNRKINKPKYKMDNLICGNLRIYFSLAEFNPKVRSISDSVLAFHVKLRGQDWRPTADINLDLSGCIFSSRLWKPVLNYVLIIINAIIPEFWKITKQPLIFDISIRFGRLFESEDTNYTTFGKFLLQRTATKENTLHLTDH